jgi:hypothetical protein
VQFYPSITKEKSGIRKRPNLSIDNEQVHFHVTKSYILKNDLKSDLKIKRLKHNEFMIYKICIYFFILKENQHTLVSLIVVLFDMQFGTVNQCVRHQQFAISLFSCCLMEDKSRE